jgi:sulfur carrier protein ThiS
MTVHVKWFPTLVKRTRSKQDRTEVAWKEGLRPLDIFTAEGFTEADAESVMVVINDSQADNTAALNDGDRLEFMVSIQGG